MISESQELLLFLVILINTLMDLKDAHFACSEIAVSESTNFMSIHHGMEVSTPPLALLEADQEQLSLELGLVCLSLAEKDLRQKLKEFLRLNTISSKHSRTTLISLFAQLKHLQSSHTPPNQLTLLLCVRKCKREDNGPLLPFRIHLELTWLLLMPAPLTGKISWPQSESVWKLWKLIQNWIRTTTLQFMDLLEPSQTSLCFINSYRFINQHC